MTDLGEWLAGLDLEKYAAMFAAQEIDFATLRLLTEDDVRELGLPIGPRRRLLQAIAALRDGAVVDHPDEAPRPSEAERRQLTVMFVDLASSTSLSRRYDPEAVREVLRAYQDAVAGEIGRVGGHVAKLMGDGVLAYFGWPQAHEDDAARAARAGLAIAGAVAKLTDPAGEPLVGRVGVATGLVVVGDLIGEGAAQEHAVVGTTPNLAARLQEVAGPGEVLIAAETRRLLGAGFTVDALGERALKGHDEPVPLFRVLRHEPGESRFGARGDASSGPIIGRTAELGRLLDMWRTAKSGAGQAAVLAGEAGIGKSRLLRALSEAIAGESPTQLAFQCSPFHSESPFWPVLQQRAIAAAMEGADDPTERPGNPPARRGTIGILIEQLLACADARPTALVFEDVQWADRATIELLRRLADAIAGVPILLVVTTRIDGEPRLGFGARLRRLALRPLERPAAAAVIAGISGTRPLSARVTNQIIERSDGIPLFIEEITKAVIEATPDGIAVAVPPTLRDSLIARLDVSPRMKAVAQIAACIGRDFEHRLLAQIADIRPDELQQGLDALLAAGLVLVAGDLRYTFKNALIGDIAYETLLTPRRQNLHRRIAETIEAGERAQSEPELLARHWFAAGQRERAEAYWLRARQQAAHWQEQFDALADYLEAAEAGDLGSIAESKLPGRLH